MDDRRFDCGDGRNLGSTLVRCKVDGSWVDAWTRRRFGFSAGFSAVLAFVRWPDDATAKKNKGKKRKKRCKRLLDFCTPGGRRCCGDLNCEVSTGSPETRCCKVVGKPCRDEADCCGQTNCSPVGPGGSMVCDA